MSRRTARERVIQALYECEFHPDEETDVIRTRGEKLEQEDHAFYLRLAQGVREHQAAIDPVIERHLKEGWSLARISSVDRAIMRLAVYELMHEVDTPRAAILNEAVDLAKAFSGVESGRFVNGVLGRLVADLPPQQQVDNQEINS
ncbi:transcription antitermination factor NusB [Laceyella sacchari]|jgi:N utilization substance protein B|uniref:Transcription antitermination protein NusB n=1 Tax=Laceyella tengchongensis TaxID=574699 RepID=A0AA45WR11_9BACL|nr:transcription antitermination factor NusB [Laceyella tengchongensis]AUS08536.1 transcription antitermination factor NusB [Laceyella sacchari]SMP28978.1 NusB antitermination factor [Laceyella tengchongensis]